jgi:hypothetical protein
MAPDRCPHKHSACTPRIYHPSHKLSESSRRNLIYCPRSVWRDWRSPGKTQDSQCLGPVSNSCRLSQPPRFIPNPSQFTVILYQARWLRRQVLWLYSVSDQLKSRRDHRLPVCFRSFLQNIQENAAIVSQIRPRPLPSTFFWLTIQ